jgi:hypothetical protein
LLDRRATRPANGFTRKTGRAPMFTLRHFGFFILMGLLTSLSACATGRTNLAETGAIDVQVENTPKARIQGVTVLADQEETLVYGRVQRRGVYGNPFSGRQVTARAVLPDGSIHKAADRLLTKTPRSRSFRAIYPVAQFKIVFPERLPSETILYLKFAARDSEQVS